MNESDINFTFLEIREEHLFFPLKSNSFILSHSKHLKLHFFLIISTIPLPIQSIGDDYQIQNMAFIEPNNTFTVGLMALKTAHHT